MAKWAKETPDPGLPHRDADGWVAAFAPEEEAPIRAVVVAVVVSRC